MRYTVLALVCLALGCGPKPPAVVEARALVLAYRDQPDPPYTGHAIRVNLPAESYTLSPTSIGWHAAIASPPVIVFICTNPPPADNLRLIEVTGVCRGRVPDGVHRGFGIAWYIRVDSCTWSHAP